MNKIWGITFLLTAIYYLVTNTTDIFMHTLMNSYMDIAKNLLIIAYNMLIWSGIMAVFSDTFLIGVCKKITNPIIRLVFKKKEYQNLDKKDFENISLNLVGNIIGLGNSSTIYGLKEVEHLNSKPESVGKRILEKFVLINTASIQIIPISIIGIRIINNAQNPYEIVIPVIICSISALVVGIFSINLMNKVDKYE